MMHEIFVVFCGLLLLVTFPFTASLYLSGQYLFALEMSVVDIVLFVIMAFMIWTDDEHVAEKQPKRQFYERRN